MCTTTQSDLSVGRLHAACLRNLQLSRCVYTSLGAFRNALISAVTINYWMKRLFMCVQNDMQTVICGTPHQNPIGFLPAIMCTTVRNSALKLNEHTDETVTTINYYLPVKWKVCNDFKQSCRRVHDDVKLSFLCFRTPIRPGLVFLSF